MIHAAGTDPVSCFFICLGKLLGHGSADFYASILTSTLDPLSLPDMAGTQGGTKMVTGAWLLSC